jgi:hypothetical protein
VAEERPVASLSDQRTCCPREGCTGLSPLRLLCTAQTLHPPLQKRTARNPLRRNGLLDSRAGLTHGWQESEDDSEEEAEETEVEWKARALQGKPSKAEKLDNMEKNISYAPFRRNFYIEAAEIAKLDEVGVKALRRYACAPPSLSPGALVNLGYRGHCLDTRGTWRAPRRKRRVGVFLPGRPRRFD